MNKVCTKFTIFIFIIFSPVLSHSIDLISTDYGRVSVKGYYKNLLSFSKSFFDDEEYWEGLNRLRLDMDAALFDDLLLKFIYDNEGFLGDYLDTQEFELFKESEELYYLDLENNIVDEEDVFWRHLFYRAYLEYYWKYARIIIGRQRIAWGTGKFWNPTDLLNPYNPLLIEREERAGVDSANIVIPVGALSSINLVYAHRDEWDDSSLAGRIHTNIKGYDFSLMGGKFKDSDVIGFDFAGYIGDAGFHGEASYTDVEEDDSEISGLPIPNGGLPITQIESKDYYFRAVIGGEYTFKNSLNILLEYYYNGQGNTDKDKYQLAELITGDVISLGQNYIGLGNGYDISPLVRFENYIIYNLNDNSIFIGPLVSWSALQNLDVVMGINYFDGESGSEFGEVYDVYYAQLQWFF